MTPEDTHIRGAHGDKAERIAVRSHDATGVPEGGILRLELLTISKLIQQLEPDLHSLPPLAQASFIWPETEERYAMKEELEAELTREVEKLMSYLPELDSRIRRYRENAGRLEADTTKLNHEEPLEHYAQAQEIQGNQYREAIHDRDAVSIILAEGQAVLRASRRKEFPGRKPVRQFPFPGARPEDLPHRPKPSDSRTPADTLGDDMDSLISLGPLGRREERSDPETMSSA